MSPCSSFLLNSHGKYTFIAQVRLGIPKGRGEGFPYQWSLRDLTQDWTLEGCSVSLWGYETVKSLLLGEVLSIFGAQNMPYLEPLHGGCSVGVALLIKAICLPSRVPPYMEARFLLSVCFTI